MDKMYSMSGRANAAAEVEKIEALRENYNALPQRERAYLAGYIDCLVGMLPGMAKKETAAGAATPEDRTDSN